MSRASDHILALGEVIVPDGVSGPWAIESFTITTEQADYYNLMHMNGKGSHHAVSPGNFKRLVFANDDGSRDVVMSNTPMEVLTNAAAGLLSSGRVLVNGLGLGMLLHYILQKPEVTEVVVVERDLDVIKLVAPSFMDKGHNLTIVHADAFEYEPSGLFNFVWHDIWTFISDENLEQMDQLEAKYAPIAKSQLCWARNDCEQMKREMDDMVSFLQALRGQAR